MVSSKDRRDCFTHDFVGIYNDNEKKFTVYLLAKNLALPEFPVRI